MKPLALAVGLILLSGTAMAQTDLQQKQMDKNEKRRNRQAEAIKQAPADKKVEAAQKAHERNQDVRSRQKDTNRQIDQNR